MIYSLLFIAVIGLLLNYLSQRYVFTNFYFNRNVSKSTIEINEEFEIIDVIENKKIMPVTFLQIAARYSKAIKIKHKDDSVYEDNNKSRSFSYTSTLSIMPYQRIKRIYKAACTKRGRYLFEDIEINAGDILGINTFRKEISVPFEIVVLPERYDISMNLIPYGDYYGDISVRRWIIDDPVLTVGIREYTGFEPQKTIHWPSSLKSGKLMVRKFDFTTDNRVLILLNIECAKPFWFNIDYNKIEKCISIARTIAEDFNSIGVPYGFGTNALAAGFSGSAEQINSGWGEAQLSNVLEYLGRIEYSIDSEFEEFVGKIAAKNEAYTTCIIITPNVNDLYIDEFNSISERFLRTVVISLEQGNLDKLNNDIISLFEGGVNN